MSNARARNVVMGCVAASLGVATTTARASPTELICDDERIRVEGQVPDRWVPAVAAECERLASRGDTDAGTRLRIAGSGDDLVIEATTRTGRRAVRRVRALESLPTALEALLVVPGESATTAAVRRVGPSSDTTTPEKDERPAAEPPSPTAAESSRARADVAAASFELAGAASGRVAGAFVSLGPTLDASLVFGSWLLGVDARWEVDQRKADAPPGFEMQTVGVGLALARRSRFDLGDVDLGLAARVLVETQTTEDAQSEASYSATDVRLAGFSRLLVGHGAIRAFGKIDTELAPTRLRRTTRLATGLPALPAWSASVSLGVAWDAR